ncbi:Fe2+-dependent dioxygenase [Methylomonas paludis]|uniref:Fe2+-dependent dioxygenase n=1 Tax=Methylomonas paludis TaxID=1173101 RepID=A0A975MPK5_9GAMM|nr:Fe2+-dependent dioxygenase [Methylomonas paludis]QWF71683.1 Fe2+-dependent dioxygenase [Methylomonas paludis]
MLLHIEKVLNTAELQQLRQLFGQADWVDGRVTAGYQSTLVKNNLQIAEQSPLAAEMGAVVLTALQRCEQFCSAALPRRIYPPLFNCYSSGMSFGYHVDNAIRGSVNPIRTDLSVTLFLSEPEDYEGGELVIADTYGTHQVKLPAGDLVLYPSSSLHRVVPVRGGVRNACFFWLQSMVRDPAQRQLLYDMDQAIIGLHCCLADSLEHPELLRLAACYHNLLRQWAEV